MSLIPLEDQMIQINVSVLYANTTGFIVIVWQKKNMQTPQFQRKWTIRRVFCYGNELLWLHRCTNKDSFYSVHRPVKWTSLFVRGVTASQYALSSQVCYRCLWLCCKIACSKYELIPLHWNAPNPNKRPTFTVDSSSAPLMDRLSSLFTPCRQKDEGPWIFTTK